MESTMLPTASTALVREYAKRLVEQKSARLQVLQALPRWEGEPVMDVGGTAVHVQPVSSQLAAIEAIVDVSEDEFLILLTDMSAADLGDAVMVHTRNQSVEILDQWSAVPSLFGATALDRSLTQRGNWVPAALLERRPASGWPQVPNGSLTGDVVLFALLSSVLGSTGPDLDEVRLLEILDNPSSRSAWRNAPLELRQELIAWTSDVLGTAASLALTLASESPISTLAFGLAFDVLWPDISGSAEPNQVAARTRVERFGNGPINAGAARRLADSAIAMVLRRGLNDTPQLMQVLTQAEELLNDLGWAEGAERSSILPQGLAARLRMLGQALDTDNVRTENVLAAEGALREILGHHKAEPTNPEIVAAQMAVRVGRWLTRVEKPTASLEESLSLQMTDGAWIDRARSAVWSGSVHESISVSYNKLADQAAARRASRDGVAAAQASKWTQAGAGTSMQSVPCIESVLEDVVRPLKSRSLLIVLDGMSASNATEIAEGAAARGWQEQVRVANGGAAQRMAALAVFPTVTTYSRTSLFAGYLKAGQQSDEKALFNGPLFHKNDLRAPAGQRLSTELSAALADQHQPLVAVVLNTIDDTLAKHDPGGTQWRLENIQYLRELFDSALEHGRTVILTSDHGHVVERGSTSRPVPGAGTRWRPETSGPPSDGEILFEGLRVLAPGGKAVLPWLEDIRYGNLQAGYHGGASLAEMAIPLLVFSRPGWPSPAGWAPAPPQAPVWWNERVIAAEPVPGGRREQKSARKKKQTASPSLEQMPDTLFELEHPPAVRAPVGAEMSIAESVLASTIYHEQSERAGRRALTPGRVQAILQVLVEYRGRVHKDTLAQASSVSSAQMNSELAALKRLLNVEGYPVLSQDSDGVTVLLDLKLLSEQFELDHQSA